MYKNNIVKRIISILLVIALAASLVGCSVDYKEVSDALTRGVSQSSTAISGASNKEKAKETQTTDAATISRTSDPDATEDEELAELEDLDTLDDQSEKELTTSQKNALNMLNYITVLTQEINDSKGSRLYLESLYTALCDNTYPNAVDASTQRQLNYLLNAIESYRMIDVKRDRLQYIYEQNRAHAIREAVPSPVALLSVVKSDSWIKAAVSVVYMAVDSVKSYEDAASQADKQFLQDGWELDDQEAAVIHKSRTDLFNYMVEMTCNNDIPGDYSLTSETVKSFVEWKNNPNLVSKTSWLENRESTYQKFGPYWLELAKCYYDSEEYDKCLDAIAKYESISTRIFRKDTDYAKALTMAISSAKEVMKPKEYVAAAEKYSKAIMDNSTDSDWALRYFVAQIYIDMYANSKDTDYLEKAYIIAKDNVNVLVDEQKDLNNAYLSEIEEAKPAEDATKQDKADIKQYNKLLKAERKTALPPISEALYLSAEQLLALATKLNKPEREQKKIEAILHDNGEAVFLSSAVENRFWLTKEVPSINPAEIDISFDGKELQIPASCLTDRYSISVSVSGASAKATFSDWVVKKVDRPKDADCSEFTAILTSENAKDYKYRDGDKITISVTPVKDTPDEVITFEFEVNAVKKAFVFNGIVFERK